MKPLYNYLLIVLLAVSFGGCAADPADPVMPVNAGDVEVSFQVAVPVDNPSATRQATSQLSGNTQENMIRTIDILAFKVNPDNSEYFDYYSEGKLISGAGTPVQTFRAAMRAKDHRQRFVIIANAHDQVMKLIASVEWRQAPKDEMLKMLEFTNKAPGHKWNASNTSGFTPFPMWGEMPAPQLITSSTTGINGIQMLRMVAKIDVLVAENDAVAGKNPRKNFILTEVYLYNVKDNGHVVPDRSALTYPAPGNIVVDKPTIPSAPANWAGPLKYTAGDDISLTDEIYTLEAAATDLSGNRLDATGLVIGGYYSNDGVTWDTNPSYYRLDMMTTDKTATRDILRNHNYQLRITEVKGPGNPTIDIAWNSTTPMELMVANWEIQTVPGDILKRQLNTSATKAAITGVTFFRIYFWSDQPTVKVEETGYMGTTGNTSFAVNQFFDDLAGNTNTSMFHYNPQTGEGYMDIATISTAQTDNDIRRIYLNANGLRREIVINTNIVSTPRTFNEFPWVGTFHRNNEVGERVIYSDHVGEWSAEVDDPKGKGSFVILSKVPSRDAKLRTDSPGGAEDYPVFDGVKSVKGTGRIYFRVGMTSKYNPTTDAPARYATVTVKYSGGTKKLYVRQGEEADYLMKNGDAPNATSGLTVPRTLARRFSPYNLTDAQGRTGRVGNATGTKYVFAQYPTQAGYYFQWGRTYAWYPDLYTPTDWLGGKPNTPPGSWDSQWESCPDTYRRPRNALGTGAVLNSYANDSEICQSLLCNPINGSGYVDGNSIWGYYADGFFDRRIPHDSANETHFSTAGSGAQLAYIGTLFYNPYNGASLFIPASGFRSDHDSTTDPFKDGVLISTGSMGSFWSANPYAGTNADAWLWQSGKFGDLRGFGLLGHPSRRYGASIRCIKDE